MYIVADIGGTKTRIAGSRDLENFGDPVILDTPQRYEEGLTIFGDVGRKLADEERIEGVVAGIKSIISDDKRVPLTAPQNILRDWKGRSLAADLEAALKTPFVRLENDTALVGLGEAVYGAGKGVHTVAYITVSTGVNGSRVIDGVLDQGHPEIGGQYLRVEDSAKSLEELVSGAAISEKYGVHPKAIDKDSPIWEELAQITAFGVHNTIVHWSPDRVVLGGSMFNEIGIPVERVRVHVQHIMRKFPQVPEIVHSSLGEVGGLWGSLALLKKRS